MTVQTSGGSEMKTPLSLAADAMLPIATACRHATRARQGLARVELVQTIERTPGR